jgi:hypothetical protein
MTPVSASEKSPEDAYGLWRINSLVCRRQYERFSDAEYQRLRGPRESKRLGLVSSSSVRPNHWAGEWHALAQQPLEWHAMSAYGRSRV